MPLLLGSVSQFFPSEKKEFCGKIINLMASRHFIGGIHTHLLVFNKLLADCGIEAQILTNGRCMIEATHALGSPYGLPSISYDHNGLLARPQDIIACNPKIVICNWLQDVENALKARENLPFKVIYVHHDPSSEKLPRYIKNLSQCDGIVVVDPRAISLIEDLCKKKNLKIPVMVHIPPFVEAEKFLKFSPKFSKKDYFKQEHTIDIVDNLPIITMIANMIDYKNHQLLFKVLDILRNQRNKNFQVFLAGTGRLLNKYKNEINVLSLSSQVHFLGQVQSTPELLYHSDIHVLASCKEGFPIVQMEAGIMKKPFIGSDATSVTTYIQQGVNGFVFKDNDAEDLANMLEYLLDNPSYLKAIGKNAHTYALENFLPEDIFAQWLNFLSSI